MDETSGIYLVSEICIDFYNVIVIILKVLPCKRAFKGSMSGYQQVVKCTDNVMM